MSSVGENLTFVSQTIEFSELNFHEIHDKLNSEIPQELEYEINNVLTVVKMAIEKLKVSLILPKIFENPKVLHQHLENTEYENCLQLIKEYRAKRKSESLKEPNYTDYQLLQIIEYFQEHHEILKVVPNWLDDIDNTEKALLKAFEDVYDVAKKRFHRPATADLAKEKRLHEVYLANENVKKDIREVLRGIENKKLNRLWKYAAKSGVIKSLEDELAFHQFDNDMIIKKEIVKSYREIQKIQNIFTNKNRELEEEFEKSRLAYEKQLKMNLLQEKRIQDEKNKFQLQLQAIIDKYDQTLLEKFKEELFLQDEYDRQKEELDEFLEVYKREEEIYNEVVLKQLQEDKLLHEAKVLFFTQTRAAKKIQRWWRKYLRAKRQKQKRLAKGKKAKDKKAPIKVKLPAVKEAKGKPKAKKK